MLRKAATSAILLILVAAATTATAPVKYAADVNHSTVGFSVPIMDGVSRVQGKFTVFTVDIDYDEKDITKSSVSTTIKATSINTGVVKRDDHLRTDDFFGVDKYPDITFKSNSIVKKGNGFLALGTFTMHGISKDIAIPFTVTGKGMSPDKKKTFVGFRATLTIDRRDFGITYQHNVIPNWIGNQVSIELDVLAAA